MPMAGRLTTHVLDTAQGRPAAGMWIELWRLDEGEGAIKVAVAVTNDDGRPDGPLLADDAFVGGRYELRFAVGAYFSGQTVPVSEPAFLDVVPIRFAVAEPDGHYHIPLLTSPWAYSTYRGS